MSLASYLSSYLAYSNRFLLWNIDKSGAAPWRLQTYWINIEGILDSQSIEAGLLKVFKLRFKNVYHFFTHIKSILYSFFHLTFENVIWKGFYSPLIWLEQPEKLSFQLAIEQRLTLHPHCRQKWPKLFCPYVTHIWSFYDSLNATNIFFKSNLGCFDKRSLIRQISDVSTQTVKTVIQYL